MKHLHVLAALAIAVLSAPSAQAQFGLYGAPELLRLPPIQQASAEQASQFGQVALPLPPAAAGQVADSRMPRTRNTRATFVPDDPGYTEQVMRPVIETPVTPVPEIPSLGNTYVGMAPADSAEKPARMQKPQPRPAPERRVGDEVVSHMLRESGCFEPNPWTEAPGDIGCGSAECAPSEPCFCSPWFVGVSGLVMGRDAPNRVWTTYSTADQAIQLMHTRDITLDWEAGAEITFGRRFCCDTWSVEATYWSLNAFSGFASQTAVGGVSTPLDFTDVIYANAALDGAGLLPQTLFDNSQEHRLWRTNEIHNIEINLVRNHVDFCLGDPCMGNPLAVEWMIGARFLRFEEDLTFGSLEAGAYTWAADPDRQGFLENQCTNNLTGFQFGCNVDYNMWRCLNLFIRPKIGIYNNHIRNSFMAYRGDGELFAPDPTPAPPPVRSAVPGSYPVNATVDALSFMTEVDLGLEWKFLPNWSFTAGYRVLVATGMGLSDNQIPFYVVDIPELANINHNGQLVLHGVFSGFEFNY
jgi:hypothetical protein